MRGTRLAWVALGWISAACSFAQDPTPGSPSQDVGEDASHDAGLQDADPRDGGPDLDAQDADTQDADPQDTDLDASDVAPDAPDADADDADAPDVDDLDASDVEADADDLDLGPDADAQDLGGDTDLGPDADAPEEPFLWAPVEEPPRCPAGQHDDGTGACALDALPGLWAWFDAWGLSDNGALEDESGAGHPLTPHNLSPTGEGSLFLDGRADRWASLDEARGLWGGDFTLVLRAVGDNLGRDRRYGLASNLAGVTDLAQALSWRLYAEGGRVVWEIERGGEVLLRLAGDDEPLSQRDGAALVLRRQGDALGFWVGSQAVAQAGLPANTVWSAAPLLLGGESYDPSAEQVASPWEGELLELQLLERALSDQEIASLLPREGLPLACAQGFQDDGEGRCRPAGVCALSRSPASGALCLPERGLVRRYSMERAELCGEGRCTPNEGAARFRTPDFALYLPYDARRASTSGLDSALKLSARPATASAQDLPSDNSARTVALWVRTPQQGELGASTVLRYGNDDEGQKVELRLERAEQGLRLWVDVGQRAAVVELASDGGAWRHVAYTYDNDGDEHQVWVNGRLVAEDLDLGELDTRWGEDDLLWFGPLGDLGGGSLDEVRIYERALSVEELQALYEGGRPTRCLDGWHHDGRGGCAREGLCAQGRWQAGDGLCLPEGECGQGYNLSERGVCVPEGSGSGPQTCQDAYDAGARRAGVYHLWGLDLQSGRPQLVPTYCEQGWGGGWALVARGGGQPGDLGFDGPAWTALGASPGAAPALLPEDAIFYQALQGPAQELLLVLEHPPGSGRFVGQRVGLEDGETSDDAALRRVAQCTGVEADFKDLASELFLGLDASGGESCEAARCNFSGANGRGRLGLQATALDCEPRLLVGVGLTVPNVPISAGLVQIAPSGFTSWREAAFYLYAR